MFFGAADLELASRDPDYPTEVDAEIIGGVTMAFTIISPAILLAYAIEGREAVMRTALDAVFCLVGAIMMITLGGTESQTYIFYAFQTAGLPFYIRIRRRVVRRGFFCPSEWRFTSPVG